MSTQSAVAGTSSSSAVLAAVGAAREALVGRQVDLGLVVEAEALHVALHRLLAELLADLGPDGVDRVRQRPSSGRCGRSLAPPALASGTPEISFPLSPSSIEPGVNLPLSIAAIAVTTFIVEPGG